MGGYEFDKIFNIIFYSLIVLTILVSLLAFTDLPEFILFIKNWLWAK